MEPKTVHERWRFELFGRFRARHGERTITHFRTHKTRALLAYLAYYADRAHTRDSLIDRFWPEDDTDAGRNSLRVAISALRRELEGPTTAESVLVADRAQVRLNSDVCTTDVSEFEAAMRAAESETDAAAKMLALTAAIELYAEEGLLPDFDDSWIEPERTRLSDMHINALRHLVRTLAQTRDLDRAIDYARRAVSADPLREDNHRNLMRLYMAIGRPNAARQQYAELERLLSQELGIKPSASTQELVQQLGQGANRAVVSLGESDSAAVGPETPARSDPPAPASEPEPSPAPAPPSSTGPLPPAQTVLFGREEEILLLHKLLLVPETRLVTLLGAGGAGKTRLAVELAHAMREPYQERVWFVPLADVADPRRVPDAIADAVGAPRDSKQNALERICTALTSAPALVVLDNVEHLLAENQADASAVADDDWPGTALFLLSLLGRLPQLTCLATSRQRLNLAVERDFPVFPLPTPSLPGSPERLLEFPSVRMFVERARRVRHDFQLTPANAAAVGMICHRLDGMPLAIELAAAWAQMLTPAQMLDQLSRQYDLLVSRRNDSSPRHRTLFATLDYSYRMLTPEQQHCFSSLGVFRGGWTLDAAASVQTEELPGQTPEKADVQPPAPFRMLELLTQLADRSLLIAQEVGNVMRFRILETVREYALSHLSRSEQASLHHRHAEWFARLAESAYEELIGADQASWLLRLDAENDNIRAALAWCLSPEGDPVIGLRMARSLWRYWSIRGHTHEGRDWIERAMQLSKNASPDLRAHALQSVGILSWMQSDYKAARTYYDESLSLRRALGDTRGIASTLTHIGNVVWEQGNYPETRAIWEEALALFRQINDQSGIAMALQNLGNLSSDEGNRDLAEQCYEESLSLFRLLGDSQGAANLLANLGLLARDQGNLPRARAMMEQSLYLNRELGTKQSIAINLVNLANLMTQRRDVDEAKRHAQESLSLFRDMGEQHGIAFALEALAKTEQTRGDPRRFVLFYSAAAKLRESLETPAPPVEERELQQFANEARAALSAESYEEAQIRGTSMPLEQIVQYALAQSGNPLGA